MKASIVEQIGGKFKTVEVEIAAPLGREVLIKVKASGLCHSDVHVRDKGLGYSFPALLGHEVAGIVEEIGDDVTDFKIGDHVVGSLIQYCGHCENCVAGKTINCKNPHETLRKPDQPTRLSLKDTLMPLSQGYGLGGFAEKALIHQNQLAKIPDEMPFDKACIIGCSTLTGAGSAINTSGIRPGDTVAVIGTGGVGLNAISGAKIAGASTIIAIDVNDEKLEFSKRFGATHTINSTKENVVEKAKQITHGGVTAAFDVVGLAKTSEDALKMAQKGGSAFVIGLSKPETMIPVNTLEDMIMGGKRLQGVYMGSSNLKRDIPMYVDFYLQGRMNLNDLVYQKISIDDIEEAYQKLNEGKVLGRFVIVFE